MEGREELIIAASKSERGGAFQIALDRSPPPTARASVENKTTQRRKARGTKRRLLVYPHAEPDSGEDGQQN